MRFKKGSLYYLKFLDHNESEGKQKPKAVLNVTGRFVKQHGHYLVFANWWSDDMDPTVETRCNVLQKAVIEARELK